MSLKSKKKIIFFSNSLWYFHNFKLDLINDLSKKYKLFLIIPNHDSKLKFRKDIDIINLFIPIDNNLSMIEPLILLPKLLFHFKKIDPDLVINFTSKCNLYSSIICKYLNIKCINNITGLGSLFLKDKPSYRLIQKIYFFFLKFSKLIITQNKYDQKYFSEKIKKINIVNIESSGIKLKTIKPILKHRELNFLMISRIIKEKGVNEFLDSAEKIKNKYSDVNFFFYGAGKNDNLHKKVIKFSELNIIKYKQYSNKILNIINKADCIILPSYREGSSRTLLEACLCSKPIIATNVPGCNNIAINGYNAILCKSKSVNSLISAIESFIKMDSKLRLKLGINSRIHVKKFDVLKINKITINLIDDIINEVF